MIQIKELVFGYNNNKPILNGLNISVQKGAIYGFVGTNGAGKSTTIRLILRLLKAKKGQIMIGGKEIANADFKKIGFLVDYPVFYDHLSCFQNLELLQYYYPNINGNRITEVLEMVGLASYKNYRYKNCSTGMKQKLGIAKAFIHYPELIVLDEPMNGLDPEWVIYIRKLLIEINKEYHTTIFFTNHILSEVEKIATHIGILKSGSLVIEAPIKHLINESQRTLIITCGSLKSMQEDLLDIPYKRIDNKLFFKISNECAINDILGKVIESRIDIKNVEVRGNDLETIFLGFLK